MIGRVAGQIVHRGADHVVIDVRGVGYLVHVSERVLAELPAVGEAAVLWTDLLVREDLLQLYGFPTLVEKEWHRLLTGVQGIGAKAALSIQAALGSDGVSRAVALGDWSAVAKAKGVGPKTAQRVVNELKDKAPGVMALGGGGAGPAPVIEGGAAAAPAPARPGGGAAQAEALSALANLGYGPGEAAAAVAEAAGEAPGAATAELIRAALKRLAPKAGA